MTAGLGKLSVVQRVVTPLACTLLILYGLTRTPALLLPALILGVVAVLLWLVRRRYEGNLYEDGMRLAEKGEHLEALDRFIRAEEAWALNAAHSTPRTITKDFQRLAAIVTAIQDQARKLGRELDAEELARAIGVYIDVYSNKSNFVFGTHNLKAGAKNEINTVNAVFPGLRGRFQAASQELYKIAGGGQAAAPPQQSSPVAES